MSAPIVFLDTETTGLGPDDKIWEIAAVMRDPNGDEDTLHIFVEHDAARIPSLPHKFRIDWATRYDPQVALGRFSAANRIAQFIDPAAGAPDDRGDAVIVGANPSFDLRMLDRLTQGMLDEDQYPGSVIGRHYRPVDVGALAWGYLQHWATSGCPDGEVLRMLEDGVPWSSDAVSEALGVDPADFDRHTAMGDVRWVMAIYDRITGGAR